MLEPNRCQWAQKEIFHQYHDTEWGKIVQSDTVFFEFLILEGAQAGLNWETILKKRENYRTLFKGFDPLQVANMTETELEQILQNPGIVRNRLKVYSAVSNAKGFLKIQKEFGSFSDYIWGFTDGKQIINKPENLAATPTTTVLSDAVSNDLRKRGFKFVGSTIMYAFLQATGIVNDHEKNCAFG